MEIMGLLATIFLPWLLGVAWLRVRWLKAGEIEWPLLLGYGYLAGALGVTLLMRLMDVVGIRWSFLNISLALALLAAAGLWFGRGLPWRGLGIGRDWRGLAGWRRVAFLGLLGIILVRLAGLGLEIVWQPLLPWDAWSQWATKARVWYEFQHLVPFVPESAWLLGGDGVFWDRAPYYPPAVPLLQVWTSYGLGRWDDALMDLPWLMTAIALGLAFYGQARQWGIIPLFSLMFTYFLLSLPMLDTHVALAGEADLLMSATYGLAAMSFFHWARSREIWQGTTAVLFGLGCILVKQPGLGWALTLLPALWVAVAPRRIGAIGVGALALVAGVALFTIAHENIKLNLWGYPIHLSYTPVWWPLWRNLTVLDNWHLMFYLLPAALAVSLPRLIGPAYRAMTTLVMTAIAFIAVVFFFTHVSAWVKDYTVVNRAILHMVPMLMFYAMVLLWDRSSRSQPALDVPNPAG